MCTAPTIQRRGLRRLHVDEEISRAGDCLHRQPLRLQRCEEVWRARQHSVVEAPIAECPRGCAFGKDKKRGAHCCAVQHGCQRGQPPGAHCSLEVLIGQGVGRKRRHEDFDRAAARQPDALRQFVGDAVGKQLRLIGDKTSQRLLRDRAFDAAAAHRTGHLTRGRDRHLCPQRQRRRAVDAHDCRQRYALLFLAPAVDHWQ
jgi:hypothetical protein